jgi:hypothetical protein
MNKSGTAGKTTKKARNPASWVVPMGADHLVVPAIKQALSMLGQAREALIVQVASSGPKACSQCLVAVDR